MIPNIYRYPLDLTGDSNNNYVTGENRAIGTAPNRAIAPQAGAFFGASMQLWDLFTNKPLTSAQFEFQFLDTEATQLTGEEVWGVVVVTDPTVSPNVSLSYQALGGPKSNPTGTLLQELETLANDDRAVALNNITGKPNAYPVVPHMHWLGDTYDWDYVVTALELCLNAMALAKTASYDSTLTWIDQQLTGRTLDISTFAAALQAHIQNYNNPHQTTLTQVNVYASSNVDSQIAVEASNRQSADLGVNNDIQAHATNHNNPHHDTADSIGGYTTAETDANLNAIKNAINAQLASDSLDMNEHIANHSNPHQVTLVQLNAQTTAQISTTISAAITPISTQMNTQDAALTAHVASRANPHQLTLTQIGAWDTASINAEQTAINNHIANHSNPHGVTAAQVGTWTGAQITAQIQNGYSTPAANALNSQANWINGHTGNGSNPHGVTAYQIGGWLYQDWVNQLNAQVYANSYH
jgi:predicted nuclease of predicted toxin-antitoxin system